MRVENKLSAAEILGNVIQIAKSLEINESIQAYSVAGICEKYETGTSTFGEWTRFMGSFIAINYITGEEIQSGKAHIPNILEEILLSGIASTAKIEAQKEGKSGAVYKLAEPIEFAYVVSLKRLADDEKGGVNYKYQVEPKTEVKTNDQLGHLTSLLPPPPTGSMLPPTKKVAPTTKK